MLSAMVDMIQKCTENLPSKRAEVPVGMLGHRACITEEHSVSDLDYQVTEMQRFWIKFCFCGLVLRYS